MEAMITVRTIPTRSKKEYCFTAETIPTGIPMISEMGIAMNTILKDVDNAIRTTGKIGNLPIKEYPKC